MKRTLLGAAKILCATTMLAVAAPAMAEPLRLAQAQPDILPPHEIVTILRSTGLTPLDRPVRRGSNYVLRATNEGGEEVRVVVDARGGEVLSVTPLATASRGALPRGMTMGPYEPMTPGYVPPNYAPPPGVYQAGPPAVYESDEPVLYGAQPPVPAPNGAVQRAPLRAPGASQPNVAAVPDEPPGMITAPEDGTTGLLPPPPERFPQRPVPPTAKPVKRAATATTTPVKPKTPPLPKPKPAGGSASAPATVPATTAPQAKPSTDPVPN